VLESFNPPEQTEALTQRLEVIGKHAAPALYNAAQMKRVPLKVLWWPLAKLQEGVGGKGKFYALTAMVLIAILIGCMVLIPYPLRMEAKGTLVPVEIVQIFPLREGSVFEIRTKPGDTVLPGYELFTFRSTELEKEYKDAQDKLDTATSTIRTNDKLLSEPGLDQTEKARYLFDKQMAETSLKAANTQMTLLNAVYNNKRTPTQFGLFGAFAPPFDPKIARPLGASYYTVLSDDRKENLRGRTVKPNEELMRLGNLQGPWHAELKIPQRNIGQIRRAFADPELHKVEAATGKKYLDVDLLLKSHSSASYLGRLYEDGVTAQAMPNKNEHDETEPVVTAYVELNTDEIPRDKWVPTEQFVTGLEVSTRIRCGNHALGYSLFHGVWEWFYEKVVFFF
jgi:hypothetical protein